MAEILGIAVGFLIGWALKARFAKRKVAAKTVDLLAVQWADHVKAHAEAQAGSVAITAPGALVFGGVIGAREQPLFGERTIL